MEVFTLYDLISQNLIHRANHVALEKSNDSLTYGELDNQCTRIASFLYNLGLKKGERVGIYMAKSFEEIVAMYSASRIGGIYVNINNRWKVRQLKYAIKDCGIRILFTDSYRISEIHRSGILDDLECVILVGEYYNHPKVIMYSDIDHNYNIPKVRVIGTDIASLIYTSGSTGEPKGIMLSHFNIIQGARIVSSYLNNTETDRILGLLPFSFDYGFNQITTMFYCGGTLVLQPVPFPADIVNTVNNKQITGIAGVPSIWISLTKYLADTNIRLKSLRYITNSGGSIPIPVLRQMAKKFKGVDINLMYGLTEAFRSTYLPPKDFDKKMGSIGGPIPDVDIFVVDQENGLCGPGQTGELIHRGNLICQGYWGNNISTSKKIKSCPHLEHIIGKEKVLYSGDIVRIDEDGYLWFVSRKDHMIKSCGYRISPSEIENVVHESGLVLNTFAFGVPDIEKGQSIHVAVNLIHHEPSNIDKVMNYCMEQLPSYMVPHKIHALEDSFPLNSNGKYDKDGIMRLCGIDKCTTVKVSL